MSEETPRLSRREMREQGLLKVGRQDEQVSSDDLLTRTSELQLRRPSRREMRLQREANEAKTAEQSAKFSPEQPRVGQTSTQEKETTFSRSVHSFNFPALSTPSQGVSTQETPVSSVSAPVSEQKKAEKNAEDIKAPASQEKPVAESGRSSVFDRFHTKDKEAVSFRDRLVARTREGQLEPHKEEPVLPAESRDEANELVDAATHLIENVSDEVDSQPDVLDSVEPSVNVEEKTDETPVEEDLPVPEGSVQVTTDEEEESPLESIDSVEGNMPQVGDEAGDKADSVDSEDSSFADVESDSSTDSVGKSDKVAAIVEDGRYPTDVTMRIGDDEEEKTTKDRLISTLIILVGLLIGVILGLGIQKAFFGAEGSLTESVDTVHAYVLDYEVGAES